MADFDSVVLQQEQELDHVARLGSDNLNLHQQFQHMTNEMNIMRGQIQESVP